MNRSVNDGPTAVLVVRNLIRRGPGDFGVALGEGRMEAPVRFDDCGPGVAEK